jgi:hypothetical protein
MTKSRFALMMLLAAGLPVGCVNAPVIPNQTIALSNPIPMLNLGGGTQNSITLRLSIPDLTGFKTKAAANAVPNDVTFFAITLVNHIGTNVATDDYCSAAPAGPTIFLDGPNAEVAVTGKTADTGNNGAFAWTGVPAGQYRFRIKASKLATGAAVVPAGPDQISKPDSFFTPNNGGWEVSDNFATVTNGSSMTSYSSGGALTATVLLLDAMGNNVSAQVNVTGGNSVTSINVIDQ